MNKIKLYLVINENGTFKKYEQDGFQFEEGLAIARPYKENRGWLVVDIATGLPLFSKAMASQEKAIAKLNELRIRYNAIKETSSYKKAVERLENLPLAN